MPSRLLDVATVPVSSSDAVAGCLSRRPYDYIPCTEEGLHGRSIALRQLPTSAGTHRALRPDAGPHIGPPVLSGTNRVRNVVPLLKGNSCQRNMLVLRAVTW
jgi:hypothetical protein